jgi:hypothetical protein
MEDWKVIKNEAFPYIGIEVCVNPLFSRRFTPLFILNLFLTNPIITSPVLESLVATPRCET